MKVALVHDYLNQYGGAERVLAVLCEMFPDAPIYTLVYDAKATGYAFSDRDIRTSFLQKIPLAASRHRYFPILMPYAVEQFDLSGYDLVISDSGSYAKGIITRPHTLHISYCHTPHRYVWDDSHKLLKEFGYPKIVKMLSPIFTTYVRLWDEQASERPDALIANSKFVQRRVKKYYHRNAEVIYPPVDCKPYVGDRISHMREYFLMVGRMVPYKKFGFAIQAFNKLGLPLKIVGDGPEKKSLTRIAGNNIDFYGLVSEDKLRELYVNARALVFPQEEDFGVVAVESMSCGTPVIAYRGGGALEIVTENEDGIFFNEQSEESLIAAINKFQDIQFDSERIQKNAMRFNKDRFKDKIRYFISKKLTDLKNDNRY